ncbi:TIGR01620 family protein [Aquamicrobium sp. LC103]|uniref:YcjF family protein n=1 Tax=Aquamicrobium sp. LC103 TaxID=1120658 RepID=UPI00063E739B|nr:TIGR01620 family protein [Aquamicrobium sp. LC103]TKT76873.1 TIGR01620 family protein [Aquamicrobium sp. LC103]
MTAPRKPAAFRIEPEKKPEPRPEPEAPRRPRAVKSADMAVVVPAEVDVFDEPDTALAEPPPASPPRRRSRIGAIFLGALGILVTLAVGLWTDRLIRDLFSRSDWLGWLATGVAAVAAIAFLAILVRELAGLFRLASVEKLHGRALDALERDDTKAARNVVRDLTDLVSTKPETAAGRRTLADIENDIIDGADLIRLAETELLGPLDARAQVLILDAAKRVSVVTAVSPRALVDLAYVLFEAGRLIRRLAELYGARPGTLGFIRLTRDVLAHLAVTGAIAAGDELVHQLVGQGLAARLSAKLGEGVVNGMMTARIGVAAMETVRPMPFSALRRPGMSDFLAALTRFARKKGQTAADSKD